MTGPAPSTGIPVGPMLSMFDPIYVGINEFSRPAAGHGSARSCGRSARSATPCPAAS